MTQNNNNNDNTSGSTSAALPNKKDSYHNLSKPTTEDPRKINTKSTTQGHENNPTYSTKTMFALIKSHDNGDIDDDDFWAQFSTFTKSSKPTTTTEHQSTPKAVATLHQQQHDLIKTRLPTTTTTTITTPPPNTKPQQDKETHQHKYCNHRTETSFPADEICNVTMIGTLSLHDDSPPPDNEDNSKFNDDDTTNNEDHNDVDEDDDKNDSNFKNQDHNGEGTSPHCEQTLPKYHKWNEYLDKGKKWTTKMISLLCNVYWGIENGRLVNDGSLIMQEPQYNMKTYKNTFSTFEDIHEFKPTWSFLELLEHDNNDNDNDNNDAQSDNKCQDPVRNDPVSHWQGTQDAYCNWIDCFYTGKNWTTRIILLHINTSWDTWNDRIGNVHISILPHLQQIASKFSLLVTSHGI